jgi:hypothetical protein
VVYRLSVEKEGSYCISIDQNDMVSEKGEEEFGDGWSRGTILLIRDNSSSTGTDY